MVSKRQKAPPTRDAAIDAALRLAAKRDWVNVTLADIAKEAKIGLSDLAQMFECREDIVTAFGRRVDAQVLDGYSGSGSAHDQLFDILMERFERLNTDRAAVISILESACLDPKQMVIGLPHLARSMTWMLEACDIETTGAKGALRVAGLTGIYVWTLRTWREDESADMGKTMAVLDKLLSRAESLAGTVGL